MRDPAASVTTRLHWTTSRPITGPALLAFASFALALLPWYGSADTMRLLVEFFALVTMAQAWNLLAGFTGFVSVGQQAFIGIGAYAMFMISINAGVHPFLAVGCGGLIAGLAGALVAPALFRLRGPHFAIGTWVLAELCRIAIGNIDWFGGASGLTLARVLLDIPPEVRSYGTYWVSLGLAAASIAAIYLLLRSRFGLAVRTVRDNESSAQSVGIDVHRVKLAVYIIAAFLTGCAGAVAYLNTMFVSADAAFTVDWVALIIFVVIIGGIGTIEGPIVGALIYFLLREWLADYGTWYIITLGLIAIATMLFAPQGVWGFIASRLDLRLLPADTRLILEEVTVASTAVVMPEEESHARKKAHG
ncbi:MAG TPA: branched-chain amino acid ABC transporter permease [Paucimonas sp.]|nr:branched-chain amino acid ABC transporter permease [Paucimonas sp.]HJW55996.1 branched-chain amino acid ABC transporter permease [Burkholderiaceae bacterium]